MRWDSLFDDLEAQAATLDFAERMGEVDDRARIEIAQLHLLDRLRPAVGLPVRLRVVTGSSVAGALAQVGAQWLPVNEVGGRQALVPLAAITAVSGLGRLAAVPNSQGVVESRLGTTHVLRAVARDRSPVQIELVDGTAVDGTIDRVGADFVEVATHAAGEARRRREVREVLVLAVAALVVIRRVGEPAPWG